MSFVPTANTLCPYLVKPLAELNTDGEHILPRALGAPEAFILRASKKENNRLNSLIDSHFVNDPLIRMLSSVVGVKSRSGKVTAQLHGLTSKGDAFLADFEPGKVTPRFRSTVIKDLEGNVIGVKGFGDQVDKAARGLLESMRRRGQDGFLVQPDDENVEPPLEMSFVSNWLDIFRGLVKVAYLTSVWAFGDEAIASPSGESFRRWMAFEDGASFDTSLLVGEVVAPDYPEFFPKPQVRNHIVFAKLQEDGLHTIVKIFGGIGLHLTTPRNGMALPDELWRGCILDAATGRMAPLEPGGG